MTKNRRETGRLAYRAIYFLVLCAVTSLQIGCVEYNRKAFSPGVGELVSQNGQLPEVGVVVREYRDGATSYRPNDGAEIIYLLKTSGAFVDVAENVQERPLQLQLSLKTRRVSENIVSDVLVGATLGLFPQVIDFEIELKVDAFLRTKKISTYRYLSTAKFKGNISNSDAIDGVQDDAVTEAIEKFLREVVNDINLRKALAEGARRAQY